MKVLVACEYSGTVRRAFEAKGHDVISCDLLSSDDNSPYHYQGPVEDLLEQGGGFDLLIAHPPCTYLTNAGVRWLFHPDDTALHYAERRRHPNYPDRWNQMVAGCDFLNMLKNCNIPKKCIENSQPHKYAIERIGSYTQKVQPWMFGDNFTKGACLWLENLPLLVPTHEKPEVITAKCHKEGPGEDRWKRRSTTYPAIANAMAEQWG